MASNKKNDKIEMEGEVVEVLKGSFYLVRLQNGHTVQAHVSGKMRMNMIRILPGDTVIVKISPYDLTRGIITWNKR
ncbi:MAG: translation initiation factor IF-1 [Mollicutes bacterium]|nr:translation initiation factor IF-1 [Mollicutes bacterium]